MYQPKSTFISAQQTHKTEIQLSVLQIIKKKKKNQVTITEDPETE